MGTIVDRIPGSPMCSVAEDIEAIGGLEEEYFFEGTATQFVLPRVPTNTPRTAAGRWSGQSRVPSAQGCSWCAPVIPPTSTAQ